MAPRIDRHLDPAQHVRQRHHPAVRRVAAFLGHFLVLDLDRLDAGRLVAADGLPDVDQSAEARVGIGNQRRHGSLGDRARTAHHVGVGHQARVRKSQVRGRHAVSGHVQRLEPHPVGDPGREHLEDTRCQNEFAGCKQVLEALGGGHGRSSFQNSVRSGSASAGLMVRSARGHGVPGPAAASSPRWRGPPAAVPAQR